MTRLIGRKRDGSKRWLDYLMWLAMFRLWLNRIRSVSSWERYMVRSHNIFSSWGCCKKGARVEKRVVHAWSYYSFLILWGGCRLIDDAYHYLWLYWYYSCYVLWHSLDAGLVMFHQVKKKNFSNSFDSSYRVVGPSTHPRSLGLLNYFTSLMKNVFKKTLFI